jgi:hypothetical protein
MLHVTDSYKSGKDNGYFETKSKMVQLKTNHVQYSLF